MFVGPILGGVLRQACFLSAHLRDYAPDVENCEFGRA